jgi:hypothetical protein
MPNVQPTLAALVDAACAGDFPAARQRQLRSHVVRYAAMLGHKSLKTCPAVAYHLPDERVRLLIDTASGELSASYRRNIRCDIT